MGDIWTPPRNAGTCERGAGGERVEGLFATAFSISILQAVVGLELPLNSFYFFYFLFLNKIFSKPFATVASTSIFNERCASGSLTQTWFNFISLNYFQVFFPIAAPSIYTIHDPKLFV